MNKGALECPLRRQFVSASQRVLFLRRISCSSLPCSTPQPTLPASPASPATDTHSAFAGIAAGAADQAAHLAHELELENNVPRLLFDCEDVFQSASLAICQLLHGMMVFLEFFEAGFDLRFVRFWRSDGNPQDSHRLRLLAKDIPALSIRRAEKRGQFRAGAGVELQCFGKSPDPDGLYLFSDLFPFF